MKSFSNFVENRDNYIGRYIEYCAHRDGVSLQEAARRSLARVFTLVQGSSSPIAIITAFRGERPLEANKALNKSLESDLRELGYGFIPVVGGYVEAERDLSGKETGEKRKVDAEESFFVVGKTTKDIKTFEKNIINLIKKYRQESAVVKYPDDEQGYLLFANGSKDSIGTWSLNALADYYTKMKKGPPERQFIFEAAGDMTRSTMMAVDRFFANK